MPLIDCSECGKQVSDSAPACPQCGAPVAKASTTVVSSSHLKEIIIVCTLVLALISLTAAIISNRKLSEEENTLEALKAEAERLTRLPNMPVQISYRRAMVGPGLVVAFRNTSNRFLTVVVAVKNPTLNQQKLFRVDLSPGETRELGHLESWAFASGDTVRITHSEYKPLLATLP